MSERDLTRAMDRVAADSPPMDVSLEEVIGQARGRRRQRRAVGAGMGLAALALTGTLWWGLAGGGLLGGGLDEAPAGPTGELSLDGGDGSRITRITGDTVTAGDRTFRIEERDGSVYLVEDGVPVADLGSRVLRHGPTFIDESGPGALAAMVAGGEGLDPASVRVGATGQGASGQGASGQGVSGGGTVGWQRPDSVVRVDLADGRTVVVAGLAQMEAVAGALTGPDLWQLLGEAVDGGGGAEGEVRPVPVAVFGDRGVDIFAGRVGGEGAGESGTDPVTVVEDGRVLEGVALPGAPEGSKTFRASDGSSGFVLVDTQGPGRTVDVVVRELGQVGVGRPDEGGLGGDLLERSDVSLTVGVLAPGGEVVGGLAMRPDDFGADGSVPTWLGEGEQVTVETQLGPISLLPGGGGHDGSAPAAGPGAGAWAAAPSDGGMRPVVGGTGQALVPSVHTDGETPADAEDPHTFDVRAVVETAELVDGGPSLVIEGDLSLQGEEQVGITEGPGAGLTVYSAVVRVPEGGSLAHGLRGLDVDGDGAVDLPLVTSNRSWDLRPDGDVATLLGEPYLVTAGESGWPVLEHLDDPGQRSVIVGAVGMPQELALTPHRWKWSGEGMVVAVPGWRADPMELVGFTSTDPRHFTVDQPEGWLAPRDLVVLESAAGPVTMVSLEPARAAIAGELMVVDEQGQRRSLEQLAVDPSDPSAGAEGQVDVGSGGESAGDVAAELDGLTLDADLVPSVDGMQLAEAGSVAGAGAVIWALPGTETEPPRGLLVVPGRSAEDVVLPVTAKGESRDLGGGLVLAERTIESSGGPVLVQVLDGVVLSGMEVVGLVALDAEQVAAGAEDQWSIIGVPESAPVTLSGGLQVAVGVDEDLWVLAPLYGKVAGPERAEVPEQGAAGLLAQAGLRGASAMAHVDEDGRTLHAVTLLGPDTVPRLVVDGDAQIMSNEAIPVPGGEWLVHHVVVQVPEGSGLVHAPGFDLDDDGEVDQVFPHRG